MEAGDSLTFWGLAVLVLPGVMSHKWAVWYPENPVCAVRGSTVVIPCGYDYPKNYPESYTVETFMWCHNHNDCIDTQYVCHNNNINVSSQYKDRAECLGDKEKNCALQITDITDTDAGVYRFRLITNKADGKWTGKDGVTLKVDGGSWSVEYAEKTLCAVRGSTVVIRCRFKDPESYRVEPMMWSHNTEDCAGKSYVWHSNSSKMNIGAEYRDRAEFLGNTENNCTLMIKNITDTDAGLYRFSFTADGCELCAQPGVELRVVGGSWSVDYAEKTLCAVRGSTVVIRCRFNHPESHRVEPMMWSHNTEDCAGKSYVWHSNSSKMNIGAEYRDRAEVLENTENNCSLMIKNITDTDAGLYRFSFTANRCELCAQPGVELRVVGESVLEVD
ncbi:sialic acid-binding Ig-like lectin 12, partial [Paramormyrops kingsleyae]|uniref:sialic acid-binding Ig-like lectin 12 n=1 Tax=Paramormyrops kingsleyae TaxID=1676925 RepID=UPI003B97AD7B